MHVARLSAPLLRGCLLLTVAAIGNAAPLSAPPPTPADSTGETGRKTPAVGLTSPTSANLVAANDREMLLPAPTSAQLLPTEPQGLTIAYVNPAGWFATLPGLSSDGQVQPARQIAWRNALRDRSALSADNNHDGLVDARDVARWQAATGAVHTAFLPSVAAPDAASSALLNADKTTTVPQRSASAR